MSDILGLDHVQLAMPAGEEVRARSFYCDVLGLVEEQKPANLAWRGGAWFRGGALRLHQPRDFRRCGTSRSKDSIQRHEGHTSR